MADDQQNPQYNINQFASLVRQKYPGSYDDMSDLALTSAVLQKYPQYKSQVAWQLHPPGFDSQARAYRLDAAQQAQSAANAKTSWWNRPLVSSDTLTRALTGFNSTAEMHDIVAHPESYPEYAKDTSNRWKLAALGMAADANDVASGLTSPLATAMNFLHIPLGAAGGRVASAGANVEKAIAMQKALRGAGATEEELQSASKAILSSSRRLRTAQEMYGRVRGATTAANLAVAAQGVPGVVSGLDTALDSSKSTVERLQGVTDAGQSAVNMALAGISARNVHASAPPPPGEAKLNATDLQRIEDVRTRAEARLPKKLSQTSSVEGPLNPAQPNKSVQERLHPPGTSMNPYVSRPTEGRIAMRPGDANIAKAQGFGNMVYPLPNAAPSSGDVERVPFGPEPEPKPGNAADNLRAMFSGPGMTMEERLGKMNPPKPPDEAQEGGSLAGGSKPPKSPKGGDIGDLSEDQFRQAYRERFNTEPPDALMDKFRKLKGGTASPPPAADTSRRDGETMQEWMERTGAGRKQDFSVSEILQQGAGAGATNKPAYLDDPKFRDWMRKAGHDPEDFDDPADWDEENLPKADIDSSREFLDSLRYNYQREVFNSESAAKQAFLDKGKPPKQSFDEHTSSDFDQQFLDVLQKGQGRGAHLPDAPPLPGSVDPDQQPEEKSSSATRGPVDLSKLTPDQRHDWINANVHFAIPGATSPTDARARLGRMIEQNLAPAAGHSEIVSWLDKDGQVQFGAKYHADKRSSTPAGTPNESDFDDPAYAKLVGNVRGLEDTFNSLTQGLHGQVLKDLQDVASKALPSDSPRLSKLSLYHKALSALVDAARTGKGMSSYMKAFDIANNKTTGGFLNLTGRRGLSDEQVQRLARAHVTAMLSKWEIRGTPPVAKMLDPAFRSAVYGANDPELELRYESLLAGKTSDVLGSLSAVVNGISRGSVASESLRENLGIAAASYEQRLHRLDTYVRSWDKRDLTDSVRFIDAVEHGETNTLTDPTDRELAGELRRLLDDKRDEIRNLGTGKLENFYENYFPHLWKFGVTDWARQVIHGRRPFQGSGSFLKPRTYDTFAEGIAAGMEPITYNPVKMAMLKLHEMDRYLTAHRTFEELKAHNLVRQFETKNVPDGWVKLNDNMFRAGENSWYAPGDVAHPINRHLSPGLRGNAIYNTVSAYNNLSNQFNLGFSAFHAVETGFNSMVSAQARGVQKVFQHGTRLSGLADIATSPLAPFRDTLTGTRLMQEVMEPGRFADMAELSKALQMAGGRIHMGSEFKNAAREGLSNAWKEFSNDPSLKGAGKLAYRGIGAGMEQLAAPLMEKFVPRIKLGAFAHGAQDILDRLGPDAPREVLRHELSKLWDSIDNRFGQVVYDNLFWNRTAKDIAHITIRSVGWNMGTARELGGGVWDIKDTLQGKGLSTRSAYTISLLASTAMMGAIISHIYGQDIHDAVDLLYPRTGKVGPDGSPERVFLKTYLHDAYGFRHDPLGTIGNKMSPVLHQALDLIRNADYYGNQIRPIYPTTEEALTSAATYKGIATYLGQSEAPFSVSNYLERRSMGESPLSAASSSTAVLPAPKWVGQTKAQSLAYELYKTKLQRGPNDPKVSERIQRYHQLAAGYAAGQVPEAKVDEAYRKGEITTKQYDGILQADDTGLSDGEMSPLNRHVKALSPDEFLRVFDYATPEERDSMEDRFYSKWDRAVDDNDTDTAKKFEEREKLFHKK